MTSTVHGSTSATQQKRAGLGLAMESREERADNDRRYPARAAKAVHLVDDGVRTPRGSSTESLSKVSISSGGRTTPKSTSLDISGNVARTADGKLVLNGDGSSLRPRAGTLGTAGSGLASEAFFNRKRADEMNNSNNGIEEEERLKNVSRKYVSIQSKISNLEERIMKEEDLKEGLYRLKESCEDEKDLPKIEKAILKSEAKIQSLVQKYEQKREEAKEVEAKNDGSKGALLSFYAGVRGAVSAISPKARISKRKEPKDEKKSSSVASNSLNVRSQNESPRMSSKQASMDSKNAKTVSNSKHLRGFSRAFGFNRDKNKEKGTENLISSEERLLLDRLDQAEVNSAFDDEESVYYDFEEDEESNVMNEMMENIVTEVMLNKLEETVAREKLQAQVEEMNACVEENKETLESFRAQITTLAKENLILKSEVLNLLNLHTETTEKLVDWEEWTSKLEYHLRLNQSMLEEGKEGFASFSERCNALEARITEVDQNSIKKDIKAFLFSCLHALMTCVGIILLLISHAYTPIRALSNIMPSSNTSKKVVKREFSSLGEHNDICFSLDEFVREDSVRSSNT
eukprot:Nk52_evm50s252 gene=Nk52_evmTU50s252